MKINEIIDKCCSICMRCTDRKCKECIYSELTILAAEREMYKWHDLRKNPEDMPNDDGLYWIHGIWGSGKHAEGECEYYVHDGYFRTSWNFNVIGWKKVDPFEESDNDE